MKLNKTEKNILKQYYDVEQIIEPKGQVINHLVVMSCGRKQMHDSGYPFIRILGVLKGSNTLINLGYHDHILIEEMVNIDSLGKNIFRIMPWMHKDFKLEDWFISVSSFIIGSYLRENKSEYIMIR